MKVSVIVPCYNMKEYMTECLGSIFKQSLKDIEVICVDDGSDDGTREYLEVYQKKHQNMIVVYQENQGAGAARNRGVRLARGEFIAFMDADDFYPQEDILEYMYNSAIEKKATVCGGSYCIYRNGVFTYSGFRKGTVFSKDTWMEAKKFPTFYGYWRFLFNAEFLQKNNIEFPNYLRGQDAPFFLMAIAKAKRVYCLSKVTYCYRKEHKQVVYDERKALDSIRTLRDCMEISLQEGLDAIYEVWIKEIHGEHSALMYYFAAQGSKEMQQLIEEINHIMRKGKEKNKSSIRLLEKEEITEYIQKVNEEYVNLQKELNSSSKILIYGAGTVGRKVLELFRKSGYEPEAFVVSDIKQNPEFVENVKVKEIREYLKEREKCLVVIATFSYLHEEILNTLSNLGFSQVYAVDMEKFYLWCGEVRH